MLELLRKATKGGVRTSEFWLSALAIVLPFADNAAQRTGGTAGIVASAAVAAAYAVSRGYVKGKAVTASALPASSEAAHEIISAESPSAAAPRY